MNNDQLTKDNKFVPSQNILAEVDPLIKNIEEPEAKESNVFWLLTPDF